MQRTLIFALTLAACDQPSDTAMRFWTPEVVDIDAKIKSPLDAQSLLDCFALDPQSGDVEYHAGSIEDDDKKPIDIVLHLRDHEDVDLCVRTILLEKFGGTVKP